MKKFLVILGLMMVVQGARGESLGSLDGPKDKSFNKGFYFGAELGYGFVNHKFKKDDRHGRSYDYKTYSMPGTIHKNVLFPGLFVGCRRPLGSTFLGLEISTHYSPPTVRSKKGVEEDYLRHELRETFSATPAFVFGLPILKDEGFNVYGKVGCNITRFKYTMTEYNLMINKQQKHKKHLFRPHVALGMEYSINEPLSTRLEIGHTFRGTIKGHLPPRKFRYETTYKSVIKTDISMVKLGLIWKI